MGAVFIVLVSFSACLSVVVALSYHAYMLCLDICGTVNAELYCSMDCLFYICFDFNHIGTEMVCFIGFHLQLTCTICFINYERMVAERWMCCSFYGSFLC